MSSAGSGGSSQDQHSGPSKKFEPPKRAQMIEPVLRHAPHRRAAPQTTAAYFRTAKAEPDAPDNKRPKLDYSASLPQPRQPSRSSPDDRQQDLYRQQIQDALREASPDSRADIATAQQQSAKRPTSRMAPPPRRGRPPSPALQDLSDRMHQNVLGGRLWYKGCQDANQDMPDQLPLNYESSQHYVSTFEPLLFEEAREAVRSSWVETCDMRKTFTVDITSIEETASGAVHLHMKPCAGNRSSNLREGSIVVLTLSKPPPKGALEWAQGSWGRGHPGGKNPQSPAPKRQRKDLDRPVEAQIFSGDSNQANAVRALGNSPTLGGLDDEDETMLDACRSHQSSGAGAPLPQESAPGTALSPPRRLDNIAEAAAAAVLRKQSQVPVVAGIVKSAVWDTSGDISVTVFPACKAHAHVPGSCCSQVVQSLRDKPKAWHLGLAGALISQEREYKALHEVKNMKVSKYILKPQLLADIGTNHDAIRRMWPSEASTPAFLDFIRKQYDPTQSAAIEIAACHLGKNGQSDVNDSSSAILPFVLIQGPPGTGKTHTVRGILNVWHIVHYNRFLGSLVTALSKETCKDSMSDGLNRTLPNLARKPRILVCAPSNAATDELLQRIMDHGFLDFKGNVYRPNVVRIGSEEAPVSARAKDVWVDGLIARYMDMDTTTWAHRYGQRQEQVQKQTYQVMALQQSLQHTQEEVGALESALAPPSGSDQLRKQLEGLKRDVNQCSLQLAHLHEERDKALVEMSRLEEVAPLVRKEQGANKRMVRENLELSFVQEAEMVFTTLSSTGRRIFSRLENAFENVLVDEAAQASEIAVLQPLTLGCTRVVLVGDPQQLPATVLSRQAQLANMERSMFERFQKAGCPVTMLSVQYRMHPLIRYFPSRHFYNNQLRDGESVVLEANGKEPIYDHDLLKPYVFFDVSAGRETRQGSGSLRNQDEADLAAALFFELRNVLLEAHRQKKEGLKATRVGVITPYRQQRKCLQDTFNALCGEFAKEVVIETVDSFQGKQMDVVIMSCVRASEPGQQTGIGFVADVRRLNVAITRAKRALWILGSAATLKKNPIWQALLEDAEQRHAIVQRASAAELFPNMTELHLMQANRKAPSSEPQHHPSAKGGWPAETQGRLQVPQGVTQAARGTGAGRAGARGSRGGRQGGRERLPGGAGRAHVSNSAVGSAQTQQQAGSQQTSALADAQGSFAGSVQQQHLTPAQHAIQQGKLRQQQERQQQQQQQKQQDQPVSSQAPQLQLLQTQQQQQQQQQPLVQRVTGQAATPHSGSGMQGVQQSHRDTAYSGGAPRDPRQMPISQNVGGLQAGTSQSLARPQGPRPAGSSGMMHQHSSSQLAADPRLKLGQVGLQHPQAAPGDDANAVRRSQLPDGEILLQHSGAAPVRESGTRPAMPAIPGAPGQQAFHDHSVFGVDWLHVGYQQQRGVDAPRRSPRQLQEDSVEVGSLRQQGNLPIPPHFMHVAQPEEFGRVLQGQGSYPVMPIAAQVVQDMPPSTNNVSSMLSEHASQVPQWTNKRR